MRFAYADPPYIGCARKHYGSDPHCAEIDHRLLIAELETYDAWALSASSPSLRIILPLTPEDSRVCAWVKPFASFKPGVRVAYAWEPVIIKGWRKGGREDRTIRDWVAANITLKRGVHGAKPDEFCFWLFRAMGLEPGDEFHDLFLGSGAVTRAWIRFCNQRPLVPALAESEEDV